MAPDGDNIDDSASEMDPYFPLAKVNFEYVLICVGSLLILSFMCLNTLSTILEKRISRAAGNDNETDTLILGFRRGNISI